MSEMLRTDGEGEQAMMRQAFASGRRAWRAQGSLWAGGRPAFSRHLQLCSVVPTAAMQRWQRLSSMPKAGTSAFLARVHWPTP